jgi:hypothetical protein
VVSEAGGSRPFHSCGLVAVVRAQTPSSGGAMVTHYAAHSVPGSIRRAAGHGPHSFVIDYFINHSVSCSISSGPQDVLIESFDPLFEADLDAVRQ